MDVLFDERHEMNFLTVFTHGSSCTSLNNAAFGISVRLD
jgi:hypothetical protein